MSDFYDDAIQQTLAQIAEAGQDITIRAITSSFDPVTGAQSFATKVEGVFKALKLNISGTDRKNLDDSLKEALISGRLHKLLVPAKDAAFDPQVMDVAIIGTEQFRIVSRKLLKPATTPVLYTFIIEAGADRKSVG